LGVKTGREVKRVPLDFDYPLGKAWYGYQIAFCHEKYEGGCERCKEFARIMGIPPKLYKNIPNDNPCPDWRRYFKVDPPTGEGYQLWGTTSEGEPRSPVFKTPKGGDLGGAFRRHYEAERVRAARCGCGHWWFTMLARTCLWPGNGPDWPERGAACLWNKSESLRK